jgi:hypothetical protein
LHFTGRGTTSGLDVGEIPMKGLNLFIGRVTRLVLYWDGERRSPTPGLRNRR